MSFVRDFIFGSPPDAPDYSQLAASNKEVAKMQIDYARELQPQVAADRKRALDLLDSANKSTTELAQKEDARSQGYYDDYVKTYQPIGQKLADEATKYSSQAEQERIAGSAGADVAQAYSNAEGQALRGAARYGIGRPNANAFSAVNNQIMATKAAAIGGAQTNAGFAARDKGTNIMTNAANIGNRLPGFSQGSSGLSLNATNSGVNNSNQTQQVINQGYGIPNQYFSGAVGSNNAAANVLNTGFQNQQSNWVNQGQQMAALINAGGAAYGYGRADGRYVGKVEGPGTGISDDIPAMISDGEYVIPADVVKRKGVEFFDKLLEKHHMPAQEQYRKYGIKGRA